MTPKLTDEIRAELKRKYPDASLHRLYAEGFEIIIKAPDDHEWRNFRNHTGDPDLRPRSMTKLMGMVLVWPSIEEWDKLVTQFPGLPESFGAKVVDIAKANLKVESEKL